MLKGQQIIYVGNAWFTENKTSSHHIAEILSRYNRLLYVEGAGQRAPQVSKRDIHKIFTRLSKAWKGPTEVQDNIYVYSPLSLPFHKYSIIRATNRFVLANSVRNACKKIGFESPLLWILLPHFGSLVDSLRTKGIVYYCVDEYSAQPNVDQEMILAMEKKLLGQADVAFVVSEKLLRKKTQINPNTYLSLHGVEVEHFKKSIDHATSIPEDIASIPGPRVGFFGLIQPRVDLQLVKFLAKSRPNISFVFIGLVAQDISVIRECSNVHFLGVRKYEVLPNYIKAFDATILPYALNEEMINSNPKKLREYLAAGKPVISVRIKEVERYKDYVYIADGYREFLSCLDIALEEDSEEKIAARMEIMRNESWEARVDYISKIVSQHIPGVCDE